MNTLRSNFLLAEQKIMMVEQCC